MASLFQSCVLLFSCRLYCFSLHNDHPSFLYSTRSIFIAALPFLINWDEKRYSECNILPMNHKPCTQYVEACEKSWDRRLTTGVLDKNSVNVEFLENKTARNTAGAYLLSFTEILLRKLRQVLYLLWQLYFGILILYIYLICTDENDTLSSSGAAVLL